MTTPIRLSHREAWRGAGPTWEAWVDLGRTVPVLRHVAAERLTDAEILAAAAEVFGRPTTDFTVER